MNIGPRYASFAMFQQLGRFGVHTFFVNISQQFLSQSAPLLIGHFHPAMFVGFYALPVRLLQYTVETVARIGHCPNARHHLHRVLQQPDRQGIEADKHGRVKWPISSGAL